MANRFSSNTRALVYSFLVQRDGEYCLICRRTPDQSTIEIDHIDGDHHNNEPSNLVLLCKNCNLKLRNVTVAEHRRIIKTHSAKNVCERVRERGSARTELTKELANYQAGSPEMRANYCYEVEFRRWVLGEIAIAGFVFKRDAVNSGAEYVGCSPVTIGRYIDKLKSSSGCLDEYKDAYGQTSLKLRDEYKMPVVNVSGNGHNGNGNGNGNGHKDNANLLKVKVNRRAVESGN